jgi:polyhydroxyalkanoate synthesis regulator phasin
MLTKLIYTSLGIASVTVDKLKEAVAQLVNDEKISEEEGKKLVNDLLRTTETKKVEIEGQFKSVLESILNRFSGDKEQEIDQLKARIAELEMLSESRDNNQTTV